MIDKLDVTGQLETSSKSVFLNKFQLPVRTWKFCLLLVNILSMLSQPTIADQLYGLLKIPKNNKRIPLEY